jgi:hypothetical protein
MRQKGYKNDDFACFANQASSKYNTGGVESRPVPECLQGEATGWQRVAERPDCNTNDGRGRFSEL